MATPRVSEYNLQSHVICELQKGPNGPIFSLEIAHLKAVEPYGCNIQIDQI